MQLIISGLYKKFNKLIVLNDTSFIADPSEIFVILGESGSGKTTILRIISGLESQDHGSVIVNDNDISNLPPNKRNISFLFQSPVFLPNRTVKFNIALPLICKNNLWYWFFKDKLESDIEDKINEISNKLSIINLLHRFPDTLSGGEKQRVAMARTILKGSNIILLDEPLANVDVRHKNELREIFLNLKIGLFGNNNPIIIYVTHDQEDAMLIGDRVGILKNGSMIQVDSPSGLYKNPNSLDIAKFIGSPPMNFLNVTPINFKDDVKQFKFNNYPVQVRCRSDLDLNKKYVIGFRHNEIKFDTNGVFSGIIKKVSDMGFYQRILLDMDGLNIHISNNEGTFAVGQRVTFNLDPCKLLLFDLKSGVRLY